MFKTAKFRIRYILQSPAVAGLFCRSGKCRDLNLLRPVRQCGLNMYRCRIYMHECMYIVNFRHGQAVYITACGCFVFV